MNREYIFRGQDIFDNNWVEGFLLICDKQYYIKSSNTNQRFGCGVEVKPETVTQFISLKDKDNNRIFEGDIVQDINTQEIFVIAFIQEELSYVLINSKKEYEKLGKFNGTDYENAFDLKIIGNIFDNENLIPWIDWNNYKINSNESK